MDTHTYERLVQMLSALLIQVNALQTLMSDDSNTSPTPSAPDSVTMHDGLVTVEQLARDVLYAVHSLRDDEQPAELEGSTLAEALSRMVEETAETQGLSSRVSFSGVDDQGRPKEHELSRTAERLLLLIAREALYEVQHHTGARKLRLALSYGQDDVQMNIENDGIYTGTQFVASVPPLYETVGTRAASENTIPLDTTQPEQLTMSALSIINDLRSRLELLGGTLEIQAERERGTRILARVPYVPHVHEHTPPTSGGQFSVPTLSTPSAAARLPVQPTPVSLEVPVRVLVVDGQAVTRAGLRRLLESYTGIEVIGEAADGVQAVSETLELGPQVVLMDSHLPNGQSMEALRQIKQLNLETKVLLLSAQDREEYLYETLRAGADGYVLKDIAPDELAASVRAVARGEVQIQPQLAGRLLSRFGKRGNAPYESLTARELDVLRLLARGMRNKEIAARLYVSERTVNFHLANIYQKLNVSGRTEALSRALEQGLISA